MKITSHLLQTLVLTATSVATSVVLFLSAPAQAVNLIKNGDFGGTVDFPWEGNAYPPTSNVGIPAKGNIYQLLSEPTDPLKKYRLSFDFEPLTFGSGFSPGYLQVSIGSDSLAVLNSSSPSIFTQIFDGNGSNRLGFIYQLQAGSGTKFIILKNLAVEDLSPPSATPAPEPLTIVGTIIGGTAAFRLKKRLEASQKDDPN